jgi:hypothetical protein
MAWTSGGGGAMCQACDTPDWGEHQIGCVVGWVVAQRRQLPRGRVCDRKQQ